LVYLDSDGQEKGKHTASAGEAINLGFETNTSAHGFFILEKNNLMTSNQARFHEYLFPFRKEKMVEQFQSDNSTDIQYCILVHKNPSGLNWIPYNKLHAANCTRVHYKLHAANCTRVHYDSTSDVMVMLVNTEVNTYTRVTQRPWLLDKLSLKVARAGELQAIFFWNIP
jgi:hypothetical protein